MVKKTILERFVAKGGYDIVKKTAKGEWRGIAEASRKTNLGEMTIRRLLKANPTLPTTCEKRFWLREKDFDLLRDVNTRLKNLEKRLKIAEELLNRSLVVDSQKVRSRQELLGESREEAFKHVLKTAEDAGSDAQKIIKEAILELDYFQSVVNRLLLAIA
jgi:hypothetical protein